MTDASAETITVVVEREFAHPPEKLWRALTQPHLIEAWLMKNDFNLAVGHRFTLRGDWGSVDCEVLDAEPHRSLSYSWGAMGVATVVTFTLTPTSAGTHLRMEQAGFSPNHPQAFNGARFGWTKFLGDLDALLSRDASA